MYSLPKKKLEDEPSPSEIVDIANAGMDQVAMC